MDKYFPIVLFAYNRPYHFKKVINSIEKTKDIKKYKIYFFCDGPKSHLDKNKIKEIKKIISKKKKINFYKTTFRDKNLGLARNIIKSLNEVFKTNKAAIIIEDDIILNHKAISFINFYLNRFYKKENIGSVSAHSYIDNLKTKKKLIYYLSKRHSSWAWGTWSYIWKKINWSKTKRVNIFKTDFDNLGNDMKLLLWGQNNKYINSWAIRFNYFCFENNLKSFQPRYSKIQNIGLDGSGTHGFIKKKYYKISKNLNREFVYRPKIDDDYHYIDNYIKKKHKKSIRLLFYYYFFLINKFLKLLIK